jgi:hypothetical protein
VLVGEQHVIDPHAATGDPFGDTLRRVDEKIAVGSFDEATVRLDHAAGVEGNLHKRGDSTSRFFTAFGEVIHG